MCEKSFTLKDALFLVGTVPERALPRDGLSVTSACLWEPHGALEKRLGEYHQEIGSLCL